MSLSRASQAEHDDDGELRSFGYEPQLSRSMGLFSSLSISISCMCITAGIFTVYAYSLGDGRAGVHLDVADRGHRPDPRCARAR